MLSKHYLTAGALLVLMGIAGLRGVLDMPTWLWVWNLVMGAIALLSAASAWLKGR